MELFIIGNDGCSGDEEIERCRPWNKQQRRTAITSRRRRMRTEKRTMIDRPMPDGEIETRRAKEQVLDD